MREGPGNLGLGERVAAEGAWHVQDLGQDQSGKPWPKEREGFRFSLFLRCLKGAWRGVAAGGWMVQMAQSRWQRGVWRLERARMAVGFVREEKEEEGSSPQLLLYGTATEDLSEFYGTSTKTPTRNRCIARASRELLVLVPGRTAPGPCEQCTVLVPMCVYECCCRTDCTY